MELQYFGHASFRIKTANGTLITDPFESDAQKVGRKFPKTEANIVTISHSHADHSAVGSISGNPFIIKGPGEYEISSIDVFGYQTYHDEKHGEEHGKNTIYLIEDEGIKICHLGDLGHVLENKLIEEIGDIDVLLIPVGGDDTLDATKATEVVRDIEPKIVIPMHFNVQPPQQGLDPVAKFCKEMGVENPERIDKLKISKDKLPEETKVYILEISS